MSLKTDFNKINKLFSKLAVVMGTFHKRSDARILGRISINAMKLKIMKGQSPIRGKGLKTRFGKYRGGYEKAIKKRKLGNKMLRPVNLKLSGDFLDDLKIVGFIKEQGSTFPEIGFGSSKSDDKERGHRDGANKQAKRPIIPDDGENFAKTIEKEVIDHLNKILLNEFNKIK